MPEPSLTLILGGARSGKSAHAERLVSAHPRPWTYLATAQSFDAEMDERIRIHRERRDAGWETIEAPFDLAARIGRLPEGRAALLDCLTLWLSNHLLAEHDVERETSGLLDALRRPRGPWVVVSNEVGLGIVPDNALARRFRDAQGRLNQAVASVADHVLFVAAGLPLTLK